VFLKLTHFTYCLPTNLRLNSVIYY
jgi:hypothetical protein